MGPRSKCVALIAAGVALLAVLGGCGGHAASGSWPTSSGDLAGTRAATGSAITARNVARLHVRWRFAFAPEPGVPRVFAATPVVDSDTVYVQDLRSNVFALNRSSGAMRWAHSFHAPTDGPNGLAVDAGRVYGETTRDAFALSASNGRELWRRRLTSRAGEFVDVAPVPWKGLIFVSTISSAPGGPGTIYGLDAATGVVRWRYQTLGHGGGLRSAVSVGADGRVYAGVTNPGPHADSLLVLDGPTGHPVWLNRVNPADIRAAGFEATPVLATLGSTDVVIGAGTAGRVIAWDRTTHRRLWDVAVATTCARLLGGVETPMAYAAERLFVPVVDLCGHGRARTTEADGAGRFVALDAKTGSTLWSRPLRSPDFGCATVANDVVFTSTYDGTVYAFAARGGAMLWHAAMGANVRSCPAVAGGLLFVGSGVGRPGAARPELIAYGVG